LAIHVKKEAKEKRIILDLVKDHFIPHIVDKTISKDMFEALVGLYQSSCVSRQMLLRNKLSAIHMSKTDTMVSYLAKDHRVERSIGCHRDKSGG
jgi:hypothetical protein